MDLMQRRRVMLAAGKRSRLPREYQEVEYLKSSGTQYIDTTCVLNSACKIMGKMRVAVSLTNEVFGITGARDRTTYKNNISMYNVTMAPRADFGKTLNVWSGSYDAWLVEFLIGKRSEINGQVYLFSDDTVPFTCTSSALIFTVNNSGEPDSRMAHGSLYYFRILDETDTFVRDLVPCYRKSDNKPGLYDLCGSICPLTNSPFYINAGTGEFLVGRK